MTAGMAVMDFVMMESNLEVAEAPMIWQLQSSNFGPIKGGNFGGRSSGPYGGEQYFAKLYFTILYKTKVATVVPVAAVCTGRRF